jgi:hypothetical protein
MSSEKDLQQKLFWWHGFVEDVDDPLKLGRCRVRIVGLHTFDKAQIPTNDLPWAIPIMPYTSASASGVGISPTGIVPGSWVVGFFQDGEMCQQPMVMGTYGGLNRLSGITSKTPDKGFNDPNNEYPRNNYINEQDTNKLARGDDTENTIIAKKNSDLDERNPTALGGSWNEPESPYNAKYPKNKVVESESGHVFEVDDTPNHERIHQYHRSGTFTEIHPDGSKVEKTIGDDYLIVRKNNNISIYGNMNINVGDTLKVYTGKNIDIQISGDARFHISGNTTMQTDGNFTQFVGGNCTIASGGSMLLAGARIDLNPIGFSPSSVKPNYTLNKSSPSQERKESSSKKRIKLEFSDGTVMEVEETRKVRTENRGWVAVKDIRPDDKIINFNIRK